jgi:hypothetical protein
VAYRPSLDPEDFADDLRRCAREQLGDAASGLRDPDGDRATATHEARKDLKKVRSLLRLARECLPPDANRAENARLRGIGRALGGAREADVLVQTAEGLGERPAGDGVRRSSGASRQGVGAGARRRERDGH